MNKDLSKLTDGEKLVVWRLINGLKQKEWAKKYKISISKVVDMEFDRCPILKGPWQKLPQRNITNIHRMEIARKRSGLTIMDVCTLLGITKPTYYDWKRRKKSKLLLFWKESPRKFSFPLPYKG